MSYVTCIDFLDCASRLFASNFKTILVEQSLNPRTFKQKLEQMLFSTRHQCIMAPYKSCEYLLKYLVQCLSNQKTWSALGLGFCQPFKIKQSVDSVQSRYNRLFNFLKFMFKMVKTFYGSFTPIWLEWLIVRKMCLLCLLWYT